MKTYIVVYEDKILTIKTNQPLETLKEKHIEARFIGTKSELRKHTIKEISKMGIPQRDHIGQDELFKLGWLIEMLEVSK